MKFDILDQNGKRVKCDVVSLFTDEKTSINYIIYTDGTKNNEGKLEVYASRYRKNNNFFILEDIEAEQEWDLIDNHLSNKR